MATNIVLKRSSSSGAVPSTSDLALGEIAINTYDGKMFTKKTVSGTSSIVELTGNVALSSSAFDLINYKFVATSNQTSFSGNDANSVSLAYASGTIQVFLNGILLDPTDYTATNGTAVVLDTGANSGDILYISRFAGVNPFDDFKYVADANQTTFTGSDANSETLLYTVGNLAVYLNGVLLDATDFTATNGSSVVLASGASAGDILHIHEFNQTGLTEVHADTTPTLGGDLDMHTFDLVTTDNRNIDIIPHGTGNVNLTTDTVLIGTSGENVVVTSNGTGDMTVSTNSGTNSGTLKILDGANQNIEITPNGSGKINLDGLLWPNADGSANQYLQTDGSGNLSFVDVLDTSEEIQDTVGAMFSSNTETGITATYQDSDGTIDLALVSRNIHGVAFDGSADIDLTEVVQDTVGAMVSSNTETNITVTYQDGDGTLDFVVDAAQPNVTSLGTLTSLTVDDVFINGAQIGHTGDTDLITLSSGVVTVAGELDAVSLDISGDADIDGTLEADAITIGGVTLAETISDTVGAMVTSNTESGITVAYQDADNTLDFTIGTLNQNTTGSAATLTTARTIGGTSFDGSANIAVGLAATATALATARTIGGTSFDGTANIAVGLAATATALATSRTIHGVGFDGTANIDLSEVISDTVGAMFSSNTETGIAATYQDADNTIDLVIGDDTIVSSMLDTNIAIAGTLDVAGLTTLGGIEVAQYVTHTGDTNTYMEFRTDTLDLRAGNVKGLTVNGNGEVVINEDQANVDFRVESDTDAHAFRVQASTGRVGLGTASPVTQLTVSTAANISQVAITSSSAAVAWDAIAAANAYHVTTENTTFSAPSNAVEGAIISVELAQGGTARTIGWNTVFEFAASTAPTITATANKTDIFTFRYNGSVWQEIGRVQNMAQT